MGPALTRLFKEATVEHCCGYRTAAQERKEKLLYAHGEALIAALEEAHNIIAEHVPGHTVWLEQATQLLARLEAEAQP